MSATTDDAMTAVGPASSVVVDQRASPSSWFAPVCVLAAAGLVGVAFSNNLARTDSGGARELFWVGLVAVYAPIVTLLAARRPTGGERIALVVLLALALFVVKVLHSPTQFTLFDEFSELRTLNDIVGAGNLFSPNDLRPTSALFPGLHLVTAALQGIGDTSSFTAGTVLIGLSRVVLALSLFLVLEILSGSARVAGLSVAVYAANPNFLFFSAQFAYQSMALPLAVLAVFAVVARREKRPAPRAFTAVAVLVIAALTASHHLTTFALVGFLVAAAAVTLVRPSSRQVAARRLAGFAVLAAGLAVAWLALFASDTFTYLGETLGPAARDLGDLLTGDSAAKEPFAGASADAEPLWERAVGFASVLVVVLALPVGLIALVRRYRAIPLVLLLGAIGAAYPLLVLLRLSQATTESSGRLSEYAFLGVGFVVALAATTLLPTEGRSSGLGWVLRTCVFTTAAVIAFMGALIVGWPPYARQPGPYLAAGDPRSVEPQGVAAAEWANAQLDPAGRFLADRTNRQLVGSAGNLRPARRSAPQGHVSRIVTEPELRPRELSIARAKNVQYVLVDERLTRQLPARGIYFERGEPGANDYTRPLSLFALDKFNRPQKARPSRLFDSGDIRIYGLRSREPGP